ncbi:pyridoxal phosphate-dependent aminotransferase family protein [Pseudoruegeria sp. HB172150]|uniref:aminotransferase class I/II-fold pyridoxal phosphate-dependent enzyme n=1 Tax=Pseudoruegeria sp. HB172150 TaxID=2721164 RepID=UPI0020A6CA47|nr:pyridoxal phosphate-dependent aminotransferase family protein [Pseudoruegeria sp. HB172150]
MDGPIGPRMRIDGREVDYFCGTSYYAMHGRPEVIEAACEATRRFGMGPGTLAAMEVYQELQEALCAWFGAEYVTYLISGYASPMALMQGICEPGDLILMDAATHYSIRDAVPSLDLRVVTFAHRDTSALEDVLKAELRSGERPVVVTDGVFPSGGALAPLADYRAILDRYEDGRLVVDDSHGVGVLGTHGRGLLEHFAAEGPRSHVAGTLSKAFGGLGGIIPGDEALRDRIKERARIMRGASPPPPAAAAAGLTALRLLTADHSIRRRLGANVAQMRSGLRALGFDVAETPVPIVTLTDAGRDLAAIAEGLAVRDILVKLVAPGGYSDAPADRPSLRIAVFSEHTPEQIDRLIATVAELA